MTDNSATTERDLPKTIEQLKQLVSPTDFGHAFMRAAIARYWRNSSRARVQFGHPVH